MPYNLRNWESKLRKSKLSRFGKILVSRKSRAFLFTLTCLVFFLLPGQSYYQTRLLIPKIPLVRATNFENLAVSDYPVKTGIAVAPEISADSAILIDFNSGAVLYQKNPNKRMRPASITKLMTALVALDFYQPDQILKVKRLVNNSEEAEMGLTIGDALSVKNLLYGLLIPSGNDAAYTLADNYPGGVSSFVEAMNAKAQTLHMYGTHFQNPSGTDDPDHYTTARNLSRLAAASLKNPLISRIVKTNWIKVTDVSGKKNFPLQNVNQLLTNYWGTLGVKTGFTDEAGQCLISAANRDNHPLLSVVLKSRDRFGESQMLLNWGFGNFTPTPLAKLEKLPERKP